MNLRAWWQREVASIRTMDVLAQMPDDKITVFLKGNLVTVQNVNTDMDARQNALRVSNALLHGAHVAAAQAGLQIMPTAPGAGEPETSTP